MILITATGVNAVTNEVPDNRVPITLNQSSIVPENDITCPITITPV